MPRFEVILPPAPPEQPFEVKLRVESDTWLAALKLGLERICGPGLAEQVACEVLGDGAMEVVDPRSGRGFKVIELVEAPAAAAAPAKPAKRALPDAPRSPEERAREDVLADLFLRAPRALAAARGSESDALGGVLELALEKVACESGVAWLAEASAGVLAPAAARGARADEALRAAALPFGRGIAGFCAQEGVCLAVSDAASDPRAHRRGAAAPRTVLCAPVAVGNRVFGVLELTDKQDGGFGDQDLAVLAYLAHQAARWLEARERARP